MYHSLPKGVVPPRGKKPYRGKKLKKGSHPSQNARPKGVMPRRIRLSTGAKDIACMKCCDYRKKGHFAQDCLEPAKVPISNKTPELYICFHAFVANSLP